MFFWIESSHGNPRMTLNDRQINTTLMAMTTTYYLFDYNGALHFVGLLQSHYKTRVVAVLSDPFVTPIQYYFWIDRII